MNELDNMFEKSRKLKQKVLSVGVFIIPVLIAAALKFWLLSTDSIPFNSDEAIVALMAKHINQGELPVFFYGQAYMGSLDAILVAMGFRLFGEHIWIIRVIQSILYLGTVFTLALLGKQILGTNKAALYVGLIAAIPPINISLYTTVSLGGYGEILFLGNLLLLGGIKIIKNSQYEYPRFFTWKMLFVLLWSILAGFSFWVFGLSLVYSVPVIIMTLSIFVNSRKPGPLGVYLMIFLIGAIIGAMPWILFAFGEGGTAVLAELAGGAIADSNSSLLLLKPLQRFSNLILLGGTVIFGLRPPWGVRWLMLPLLPFVMIFWLSAIYYDIRQLSSEKNKPGYLLVNLLGAVLLLGFIFTPYGGDPSGRYFLPLIVPIVIIGANFLVNRISKDNNIQIIILVLILIYNLGGTIQSVISTPPGITTQFDEITQINHNEIDELIEFLHSHNVIYGYTNYWVSYPLAFLSDEQILYVPRLPYHEDFRYTARDDRYSPYYEVVQKSTSIGYITTNHETLDDYLRNSFQGEDITWSEERIGDYQIFYDLSRAIHPQDIDLGKTTKP